MDSSSQMRNLPEDFNFEMNVLRQRMTYQLLLDLKNVQDVAQSTQLQNKTVQQRQQMFVRIYEKHINELQKIQSSVEVKIKRDELLSDLQQLQELQQFNQECDIPATIGLFQQLIPRQQRMIGQIEKYMNELCERIQHEKYVQEQEEICQHLHKQISVFKARKGQLRGIIQNAKAERKHWHDLAIDVCRDKQTQIQQLQTLKSQQQEEVHKQKEHKVQLNQKQAELYREISKLTLEINACSLKSTKSEHMDQTKKPVNVPSEKEFRSKNFGSIIQPMPASETENPSVIFSQQNDSSTQTKTPTCFVQSGIEKEFDNRKFIILALFLLSIALWFV